MKKVVSMVLFAAMALVAAQHQVFQLKESKVYCWKNSSWQDSLAITYKAGQNSNEVVEVTKQNFDGNWVEQESKIFTQTATKKLASIKFLTSSMDNINVVDSTNSRSTKPSEYANMVFTYNSKDELTNAVMTVEALGGQLSTKTTVSNMHKDGELGFSTMVAEVFGQKFGEQKEFYYENANGYPSAVNKFMASNGGVNFDDFDVLVGEELITLSGSVATTIHKEADSVDMKLKPVGKTIQQLDLTNKAWHDTYDLDLPRVLEEVYQVVGKDGVTYTNSYKIVKSYGSVGVEEGVLHAKAEIELSAYPSPFNPTTTINFNLIQSGFAKVDIYNAQGQFVTNLVQGNFNAGSHKVDFNAANLNSGTYFARISSQGQSKAIKMLLCK